MKSASGQSTRMLVTLPRGLVDEVDRVRGGEPRSEVLRQALQAWLDDRTDPFMVFLGSPVQRAPRGGRR